MECSLDDKWVSVFFIFIIILVRGFFLKKSVDWTHLERRELIGKSLINVKFWKLNELWLLLLFWQIRVYLTNDLYNKYINIHFISFHVEIVFPKFPDEFNWIELKTMSTKQRDGEGGGRETMQINCTSPSKIHFRSFIKLYYSEYCTENT